MSAAGKKKRGESGASKGKTAPFRLFGGGCHPNHLATTMRAVGGEVEKIGRDREGSAWDKGSRRGNGQSKGGGPSSYLTYAEATAAERRR